MIPPPLGRPDLLSLATVRARRRGAEHGRLPWVLLIVAFLAGVIGAAVGDWLRP